MARCAGITAAGARCKGQAISDSTFCISHDPDSADARKRRASKGGKRGGRGRPQAELGGIKARLLTLADDVLAGAVDRADAVAVGQLMNTVIRAVSVELRVREVEELMTRLEELEQTLELQHDGNCFGTSR